MKPNREDLIDYYIRHCSDLVPYSDPEYSEKVRRMATSLADADLKGQL